MCAKTNRRHFLSLLAGTTVAAVAAPVPDVSGTEIAIEADQFFINGKLTYPGQVYQGKIVQGLLMNARLVQGIFDDRNPETRSRWVYPDTHAWSAERNTREFVAAMPLWRQHGLLSFTINLQGGMPVEGAKQQPWENSAFAADGTLRAPYLDRLRLILDRARDLGMAPIVGYFYFGQDHRLRDEAAVKRAAENATGWLLDRGYRNVLVEIANETTAGGYHHAILRPDRIHELVRLVQSMRARGRRFLGGTSMTGGAIPTPNIVRESDFLLLHGNGVSHPEGIARMVHETRQVKGYRPKPILFNEDDHYDFDRPVNHLLTALAMGASWGFYDQGSNDYANGYQSPPVNWGINTARKRAFFDLLQRITAG
jgi:hypothetical protein